MNKVTEQDRLTSAPCPGPACPGDPQRLPGGLGGTAGLGIGIGRWDRNRQRGWGGAQHGRDPRRAARCSHGTAPEPRGQERTGQDRAETGQDRRETGQRPDRTGQDRTETGQRPDRRGQGPGRDRTGPDRDRTGPGRTGQDRAGPDRDPPLSRSPRCRCRGNAPAPPLPVSRDAHPSARARSRVTWARPAAPGSASRARACLRCGPARNFGAAQTDRSGGRGRECGEGRAGRAGAAAAGPGGGERRLGPSGVRAAAAAGRARGRREAGMRPVGMETGAAEREDGGGL